MTKIKIREWVHANICVRDLARSIPFYEMLGFEKFDGNVFEQGAGVWEGLGLSEGRRFRAVFMKIPGDRPRPFLDIIQFLDPPTAGESYPTLNNVGIGRLCFEVDDLFEERRLSKRTKSHSSDVFHGTKPQRVCDRTGSIAGFYASKIRTVPSSNAFISIGRNEGHEYHAPLAVSDMPMDTI
jgi:catechol 2,3-dioxygenase-like lactoylglutathione lyase family enzyme